MFCLKNFVTAIVLSVVSVCMNLSYAQSSYCPAITGKALPGTNSALVGLYIDKDGYPQAAVDPIVVHPGQRIIFAGPNEFEILFKNKQSPIEKLEVRSVNGVVIIDIPKDIFEREKMNAAQFSTTCTKRLTYSYAIGANGKITDPTIHVEPE
jgi:hypothetical protein